MKRTILSPILWLAFVSVAALTFASCEKDEPLVASDNLEQHEVVFDIHDTYDTKMSLDASSNDLINWSNIKDSYVHIYENGKKGVLSGINVNKNGKVTVSAAFSVLNFIKSKGYTYNCIIAGDYENNVISVPVSQNPVKGSCDPAADVILAKSSYGGSVRPLITGVKLNFERHSALTKLMLSGMNADEKIQFIEIVADNPICGPFIKLTGTDFIPCPDGFKSIWLEFSSENSIAADGTFITYFSSWAADVNSLSVRVVTDKSIYQKSCPNVNGKPIILSSRVVNNAILSFTAEDVQPAAPELTFNLENDAVGRFLDVAGSSYTDSNWSTLTVVPDYCRSIYTFNTRDDIPTPVVLDWNSTASGRKTVTVYNDSDRTDAETSVVATSSSAEIYNLVPGRTYYYTVSNSNGSELESGSFSTTGRRRMMLIGKKIDYDLFHANNCRDYGGQKTTDGKTIKFGRIFRGSNMDLTTPDQRSYIREYMNISLDVDLREVKGLNPLSVKQSMKCYNSWEDLSNTSKMRVTIQDILDAINSGKNVYIHCTAGADRAGYVSMLLEAVLGVSQKDCSIDYELTSFSCIGIRARSGEGDHYFTQGMQFLESQAGATFQQKAVNYVINTLGISAEDVAAFQRNMLE